MRIRRIAVPSMVVLSLVAALAAAVEPLPDGSVPPAYQGKGPSAVSNATVQGPGDRGRWPSLVVGNDGFGLISFYDASTTDLKVAHCRNAGCTSVDVVPVDTAGDVGWSSSITIGADGFGLVSYYDRTNRDLKVAHCSNAACSSASSGVIDDTEAGEVSSITVGTDGLGIVAYYNSRTGNLKVAHCSDAACTTATKTALDGSPAAELVRGTSIAIGTDGLAMISYTATKGDGSARVVKIARCSNTPCTAASRVVVDTAADLQCKQLRPDGQLCSLGLGTTATSLTIGGDGLPIIAYHNDRSADRPLSYEASAHPGIRIAHCTDVKCTDASLADLDPSVQDLLWPAIATGADGLPVVAYSAVTGLTSALFEEMPDSDSCQTGSSAATSGLKFARCSGSACLPLYRRR